MILKEWLDMNAISNVPVKGQIKYSFVKRRLYIMKPFRTMEGGMTKS